MWVYLAAPAYVLGMMAVTIGPLLYAPYPGKAPGTYAQKQIKAQPLKNQDRVPDKRT